MAGLFRDVNETIAAASGDDAALFFELRQAFIDSLSRQIDLLRRSRCDGNWQVSAMRLQGLAASFNAGPLIALAEQTLKAVPGDTAILRKLANFLDNCRHINADSSAHDQHCDSPAGPVGSGPHRLEHRALAIAGPCREKHSARRISDHDRAGGS